MLMVVVVCEDQISSGDANKFSLFRSAKFCFGQYYCLSPAKNEKIAGQKLYPMLSSSLLCCSDSNILAGGGVGMTI